MSLLSCLTFGVHGRVSDQLITKECGLLALLSEHDRVMADHGFDIQDLLATKCITLNKPPSLVTKLNYLLKK